MAAVVASTSASSQEWARDVLSQLAARDRREKDPFRDLIHSYANAVQRERGVSDRCAALEKELHQLRASIVEQQSLLRQREPSAASATRLKELEEQAKKQGEDLSRQQEEMTGLYKEKAQQAQDLYSRTTEAQAARDALAKCQKELQGEQAAHKAAREEIGRLQALLSEREATIALLASENASLRASTQAAEARAAKAEGEVATLAQRLIDMKQGEVERMNKINEMYEELLREKREFELVKEAERTVPAPPPDLLSSFAALGHEAADAPSRPKLKIAAHTGEVNCVAFDERGGTIATGGEDKLIKTWSASTGAHSASYTGAVQAIMCVAFSADGKARGPRPGGWRARGGSCWRARRTTTTCACGTPPRSASSTSSRGTKGRCSPCASPKRPPRSASCARPVRRGGGGARGRQVSGGHDRSVKVWDLARGFCVRTILCGSSVNDLAVNADASVIVSGHLDGRLRFFEGGSGALVHEAAPHAAQITSVALLPDGARILTAARDNTLKLVDARTYEELASFKDDQYRSGLNWARAAASMDGQWIAAGSQDGVVCLWNAHTGKLKAALRAHTAAVAGCAWSCEGRLATVARDKMLIVWE